ncbi:MAG: phage minor capsid protein, partial [Candidatus Fonsibacter sp.]
MRFEEIRNTPFLDGDSSDYFCSIVRFTIQTRNTLPVFIPSVVIGQNGPNLTIYAVSLQYTYQHIVYTSTQNIIVQPEDATGPIPDPPLLSQGFSSKYYNVYNYTHFVRLVNTAFRTSVLRTYAQKCPSATQALLF